MPLIFPSNTLSAGGYTVDNSLRWNDGDSPYLSRVNGTPTNADKWTFSIWVKRGALGSEQKLIAVEGDSLNNDAISFDSSDQLRWYGITSSSTYMDVKTNRVFRDPSAWYHIVFVYDSGQGTDSDRAKIYVNGTQETSLATSTYPDQDEDSWINAASKTTIIGRQSWAASGYFDGYMAEVTFCDGQAYAPDGNFGEFNEDTPTVFQPIDVSGLTFGTNGFYLDFEDSANLGNDANGGTDFTTSGLAAADQASDSPTNNFPTLNPLAVDPAETLPAFSEGNCQVNGKDSAATSQISTMAMTNGKWYAEFKLTTEANATSSIPNIGIMSDTDSVSATGVQDEMFYNTNGVNIYAIRVNSGDASYNGSESVSGFSMTAPDEGDIISFALDLDSSPNTLKVYLNGSLGGTLDINADTYFFATSVKDDEEEGTVQCNFGGCPAFSISSGNADADGYGNFEYAVPSGYYALCTKNLAEYG